MITTAISYILKGIGLIKKKQVLKIYSFSIQIQSQYESIHKHIYNELD